MKALSLLLSLVCLVTPALGAAQLLSGPGEAGGGFLATDATPNLTAIASRLGAKIRALPAKKLTELGAPAPWTPDRIAAVIENLQIDSSPSSLDGRGKMRIINYDKTKGTITALSGFLLYYGEQLEKETVADATTALVERRLLHEVSHLWDFGDSRAAEFADWVLYWLDRNVIACNVDNPMAGEPRQSFVYSVADRKIRFANDKISLNFDQDGYPSLRAPGTRAEDARISNESPYYRVEPRRSGLADGGSQVRVEFLIPQKIDRDGLSKGLVERGDNRAQTLTCVFPARANGKAKRPAVTAVMDLPWFWPNYNRQGGTTAFEASQYERLVQGRTSEQFVREVIQANGGWAGSVSQKIAGGTLISKRDHYYLTVDESGAPVSLFIQGEEEGKLPDYFGVKPTGDHLLFFKGPRANTGATGDDT